MNQLLTKTLVFAVLLFAGFSAHAQYVPRTIEQERGRLLDDRGEVMPDYMVQRLVGDEIYNETYVGARKQYKAGKVLITTGLIGTGAGLAVTGVSLGVFISDYIDMFGTTDDIWDSFTGATESVGWFYRGLTLASVSSGAFVMGLIFKTVGWRRLEWIAGNYNDGNRPVALSLGQGRYGTGLVLHF